MTIQLASFWGAESKLGQTMPPVNKHDLACNKPPELLAFKLPPTSKHDARLLQRFLTSSDLDLFNWKLALHLLVPLETFTLLILVTEFAYILLHFLPCQWREHTVRLARFSCTSVLYVLELCSVAENYIRCHRNCWFLLFISKSVNIMSSELCNISFEICGLATWTVSYLIGAVA